MQEEKLATENRLDDPDAAFRLLVEAHRGLGEAESAALNARLVLILANQLGDRALALTACAQSSSPRRSPGLASRAVQRPWRRRSLGIGRSSLRACTPCNSATIRATTCPAGPASSY